MAKRGEDCKEKSDGAGKDSDEEAEPCVVLEVPQCEELSVGVGGFGLRLRCVCQEFGLGQWPGLHAQVSGV